jgi:hypothetical protein
LMTGMERQQARDEVRDEIKRIIDGWRAS